MLVCARVAGATAARKVVFPTCPKLRKKWLMVRTNSIHLLSQPSKKFPEAFGVVRIAKEKASATSLAVAAAAAAVSTTAVPGTRQCLGTWPSRDKTVDCPRQLFVKSTTLHSDKFIRPSGLGSILTRSVFQFFSVFSRNFGIFPREKNDKYRNFVKVLK